MYLLKMGKTRKYTWGIMAFRSSSSPLGTGLDVARMGNRGARFDRHTLPSEIGSVHMFCKWWRPSRESNSGI